MTGVRVAGHALLYEGRLLFDHTGAHVWHQSHPAPPEKALRARCECGALSAPGIKGTAVRNWHRGHKSEVLRGWGQ